MRFRVPRIQFLRLLRAVCSHAEPLLRIEVLPGVVSIACSDTEAGCEAIVECPGVCFLRHSKLKQLIQTYHSDASQSAAIEIEVAPDGIRVGRTNVSRDGWEISLFANPASAPRSLRFRSPEEKKEAPETDSQMLMPFVTPRESTPPDSYEPPKHPNRR